MAQTIKKNVLTFICIITLFCGAHAQEDRLSHLLKMYDVSLNENEYYTIDKSPNQHKCGDNNCEIHKHIPYGVRMSLLSKDGQCKIYVSISNILTSWGAQGEEWHPSMGTVSYVPNTVTLMDLQIVSSWNGKKSFSLNHEWIIDNLMSMMTKYPKKKARKLFNADCMYSIPINFYGKACQNKFTNGQCVMIGKREYDMMLYFFMTDNSAKDFDRYLEEVKGVLRYNW